MAPKKVERIPKEQKSPLPAPDRCRAVLSVWSQCRTPSEVCRMLDIKWAVLQNWEQRALEGMVNALQPRRKKDRGPALSPRLVKLLKKHEVQEGKLEDRLEQRLVKIQESRSTKEEKTPSGPPEKKGG